MRITLSTDQENATNKFMGFLLDPDQDEMLLLGSAGTGKTTLVKYLLEVLDKQADLRKLVGDPDDPLQVFLTSTTHKAAKVLEDATGRPVTTIHALLGLKPIRDYKTGKETFRRSMDAQYINHGLIVLDEASMCNESLLKSIRNSTKRSKLLFVGDGYQLPPVSESVCPVFEQVKNTAALNSIQRQVAGSPIIQLATEFRNAVETDIFPEIKSDPTGIIQHVSSDTFKDMIDNSFQSSCNDNDVKILAWRNDKCIRYNNYVRKLFTESPHYEVGERLVANQPIMGGRESAILFKNDAVMDVTRVAPDTTEFDIKGNWMCFNNTQEVFVPRNYQEVREQIGQFSKQKDWTNLYKFKDFFADVRPIYCSSVHKSQGSTYRKIFIDLSDIGRNPINYELARLMYVAVSRASEQVIMAGKLPKRLYGGTF